MAIMTSETGRTPGKIALFLHSGDYDRLHHALSILLAGVSDGMEGHLFFTYWALKRISKTASEKVVLPGEHKEYEKVFRERIERKQIQPFEEMLSEAKKTGNVKVYACSASMNLLNLMRDELIDEVDQVLGLSSFSAIARDAKLSLFI